MFDIRLGRDKITHAELLHTLPFESGYACAQDGTPCWHSILIAVVFTTIGEQATPGMLKEPYIN